jgi:hypothetical protein
MNKPNDRLKAIREQRIIVDELLAQLTLSPYDNEERLKGRIALEREKLDRLEDISANRKGKPR